MMTFKVFFREITYVYKTLKKSKKNGDKVK